MLNQSSLKLKPKYLRVELERDFFCSKETYVHSSALIGKDVELEENVKVGPFCVIIGSVTIKKNTVIYPNVSIGFPAQNIDTKISLGKIVIGENCQIREFVSISASKFENGKTEIGNDCYIMSYSHIAHDVTIQDNVTLINNVNLGGHSFVGKNAFLMANSAVHQFCKIGEYTALAPFSATRQDLPPFCLFDGMPAQFNGLNVVALKRNSFDRKNIDSIKKVTRLFYQKKILLSRIKEIGQNEKWFKNNNVRKFIKFIEDSKRGVSKRSVI